MTGLQTVAELRRAGCKPSAVFVSLVSTIGRYESEEFAFDERHGNVAVTIASTDSLADIDFRPLVGLNVHVHGDRVRQARVAKLIAAIEPARLVVPVEHGDGWTVHIRHAGNPPTRETYAI